MTMRVGKMVHAAVVLAAAMILISCEMGEMEHSTKEQAPGTIAGGVYLSKDGAFTVKADEKLWQVKESGGSDDLRLKKNGNVWISFMRAEGLTQGRLKNFEDTFVKDYMEGIRISYPDAEAVGIKEISANMARLDMTMSYRAGAYIMYQILYLVTDGENGYIITSTLPLDEAETLCPLIYELVESIEMG